MLIDHYPWLLDILGIQYKKALILTRDYLSQMETKFKKEFGYEYLGRGSYRIGFEVNSDWIIKFPTSDSGVECNLLEAKLYEIYMRTGHYAKCYIKEYHRIPLIVMENVKDYYESPFPYYQDEDIDKDLPHWAHHEDGPQVGYNKKGKLKIYDYGNCIDEMIRWDRKTHKRNNSFYNTLTR